MSMSSMGVGSGLDIRAIVDQLVAAERAPTANRLDRRERDVQTELSAYGKVRSALSAFQQQIGRLSNVDSFRAMNATSSNEDALGVSTSRDAASGRYDISIANLAQSQSLASTGFESRTEIVGGGSLTFTFGTIADDGDGLAFARDEERATHTIEVGENATLNDIRNAINAADIGVQASIINDGSGERLVLAGQDEGAASGFTIDVAADGGSRLNELAFDPEADDNSVDMIRRA